MEFTQKRFPLFKPAMVIFSCLMLFSPITSASESREAQAPGRAMAQQATKSKKLWPTTDHSKHEILQQNFKSGAELTQACISCHSEAEQQFHQTIHWTWLADPSEKKATRLNKRKTPLDRDKRPREERPFPCLSR